MKKISDCLEMLKGPFFWTAYTAAYILAAAIFGYVCYMSL